MMAPLDGPAEDKAQEWYVAYTNPRREDVLERILRSRKFAAYTPAMTVTRRRSTVKSPLFPRYLFVGLSSEQRLFGLRGMPGLEAIVRVDGRPHRIKPQLLDGISHQEGLGTYDFSVATVSAQEAAAQAAKAARESEAQARALAAKLLALVPGSAVRIVSGPFVGKPGTVDRLIDARRVSVNMNLFASRFAVPMRVMDVEVASETSP